MAACPLCICLVPHSGVLAPPHSQCYEIPAPPACSRINDDAKRPKGLRKHTNRLPFQLASSNEAALGISLAYGLAGLALLQH